MRTKPLYYPDRLPAILGCDGAGTVEEIGSAVTRFRAGDAVYFSNGGPGGEPGCYAEYTTLHENHCAAKPPRMDMHESAVLVDEGKLAVLINNKLPLTEIAQAHRLIEQDGVTGKIVLAID